MSNIPAKGPPILILSDEAQKIKKCRLKKQAAGIIIKSIMMIFNNLIELYTYISAPSFSVLYLVHCNIKYDLYFCS